MKIIDLLNVDYKELDNLADTPHYRGLVQRKLRFFIQTKKINLVNVCNYWLIDNSLDKEKDSQELIEEFVNELSGNWFEVKNKNNIKRCHLNQIKSLLLELENDAVIVIRSFPETDYCGYVWITGKNNTYIEVYKGGFWGFWNAEAIPSRYLYNKTDGIISKHLYPAKTIYIFNYEIDSWEKVVINDEYVDINEDRLSIISEFAWKINPNKIMMKIAWIINKNGVTIFDIFIPLGVSFIE